MPFTKNEQATLWYTDQGSGPPLLLIPGGLFDPINGERFWEMPRGVDHFVMQGYRVLVPDRRYSVGNTSAPFEVYSWEKEAEDFAAVVHAAGEKRYHLLQARMDVQQQFVSRWRIPLWFAPSCSVGLLPCCP